jgi:RNA-binding protein NOB1
MLGQDCRFGHLVLDAGPLIERPAGLAGLATHYYTVPEVVAEVRDEASRLGLATLPFRLTLQSPAASALARAADFAKKTGDLGRLSATDLRVIALTLELEERHGSVARALPVPEPVRLATDTPGGRAQRRRGGQEVFGDWITPENIGGLVQSAAGSGGEAEGPVPVACMSGDFAVQNVLLQMRLAVHAADGRRIESVRSWALRCHACLHVAPDTSLQFCPCCGAGDTLLRCSYAVDVSGQRRCFLRRGFEVWKRGTVYPLPMPRAGRAGRAADEIILREDQKEWQRALKWKRRQETKLAKGKTPAGLDQIAGAFEGMHVRSSRQVPNTAFGLGRRNPNAPRPRRS